MTDKEEITKYEKLDPNSMEVWRRSRNSLNPGAEDATLVDS